MRKFIPFAVAGLVFASLILTAAGSFPVIAADSRPAGGVVFSPEQAEAMVEELRAIRRLLEKLQQQGGAGAPGAAKTPTTATVDLDDKRPVVGSKQAPVTVVEFTDYQCPFCRRFAHSTFPLLKRDYIDTGKVRWQVRDLPLSFHQDARKAAQAALCAGEQDRFWKMRDSLFRNSANLGGEHLQAYAAELKLDMQAFNACLDSRRYLQDIDNDVAAARRMRITGTPTFVIGKSGAGKMTGTLVIGAQSPAVFAAQIERTLSAE